MAVATVNVPASGVEPPITMLFMVPAVDGLIVTTPVPVGLMTTLALLGEAVKAPPEAVKEPLKIEVLPVIDAPPLATVRPVRPPNVPVIVEFPVIVAPPVVIVRPVPAVSVVVAAREPVTLVAALKGAKVRPPAFVAIVPNEAPPVTTT